MRVVILFGPPVVVCLHLFADVVSVVVCVWRGLCVISYTKMGYAGNYEPNYIVPTFISTAQQQVGAKKSEIADLDFFIGDDAMEKRANYNIDYPIRHGIIDNWDNMERYWQRCLYQYLRCDPEEHYVLLVRQ